MDVQLPVYLYDVVTTDDPPRVVVTCRTEADAMNLAQRLQQTPRADEESFTVAPKRVTLQTMTVEPGSSVVVRGYEVASEVLAAALAVAQPAPVEAAPVALPVEPPVDPAPVVAPPVEVTAP